MSIDDLDLSPLLPDYTGGGIVNLMVSLRAGLGDDPSGLPLQALPAAEVAGARQVVLWVIDGLGYRQLLRHWPDGALASHLRAPMTSVFPSTTAAAITTFLTGQAPAQHAMTGWYMYLRELAAVLAVLPGRPRYGGADYDAAGVDVARLYGHPAFADRVAAEAWMVSPDAIAGSPYNRAHLGRAWLRPYRGLEGMLDGIVETVERPLPVTSRRFTYAYWSELDHVAHLHGANSEQFASHLAQLDAAFERLLARLAGNDVLLLVTADHGQIDARPVPQLDLERQPWLRERLRLPLCGERRAAYAYLRPGAEQGFAELIAERLGGLVEVRASEQVIADGWFGPGEAHPELLSRCGDYLLLPGGDLVFTDWLAQEKPVHQVGMHGGLSVEEMRVPLLVART